MKTKRLVVDSGAIIKGADLRSLAETCYTTPDVMQELRDKQTRDQVDKWLIPLDVLNVRQPSASSIQSVIDFAKKTGDIAVLSATDIRVIALCRDIVTECGQASLLRSAPLKCVTQVGSRPNATKAEDEEMPQEAQDADVDQELEVATEALKDTALNPSIESQETGVVVVEETSIEMEGQIQPPDAPETSEEPFQEHAEQDDDDDDAGWITPSNLHRHQSKDLSGDCAEGEDSIHEAACITTDFAMQNVILQMGMNLLTVDGLRVRQLKSWVLRCHGCFHITKKMEKKFCPQCGNNTLIRTSISTDPATGKITVYLKKNFNYNLRGTRYTLPTPKGGRSEHDLILREDQKEYQRYMKQNKKRVAKVDAFDVDFIPLSENRTSQRPTAVIGHGRRNPNEARRHSKK